MDKKMSRADRLKNPSEEGRGMKLMRVYFDIEYVKEAIYFMPMFSYSNEIANGKCIWIGWLKWLWKIKIP